MDAFEWNACFVTGLTDVDRQHHRLVDLINRFGTLVMSEDGAVRSKLEAVFAELADYAQYHFAQEEAMMAAQRLDPHSLAQHVAAHASFLSELAHLHGGVTDHNREAAESLLQFLTHWLAYHILGTDQAMARQIAAISAGARPDEALLVHPVTDDPATATLLAALNGLFHQVSERNHALLQLNKTLEARVAERTQALTEANLRLDELANTDALTGLPNRRHALRSLADEWESSSGNGKPLACMMIDADGFKQINDSYGHDAGDAVLRALAKQMQNAVRTDDRLCRLGGDEFLIICANTPLDGAMRLAETIRAEVATLRVPAGTGAWIGSISVGVAVRTAGMIGPESLIKAADRGVYVAKSRGRNAVAFAE